MTVYAIAQLRFTDLAAYHGYQARFLEVFRKFDGTLLAADESARIIEGELESREGRADAVSWRDVVSRLGGFG